MTISLVVITDGARIDNLKRTIDSVKDIVSETVIVFQGNDESVYSTIRGMSDFSVCVTPKGNADFDRNYAYTLATGDWILALDDDEWVKPETKAFISRIVESKAELVWFEFENLVDNVDIKEILGPDPHPRLWKRLDGIINWPIKAHTFPQIQSPMQYFTANRITHDRKFDELYARHLKRVAVMDQQNVELEKRFIAAVKQKLGRN